MTQQTTPPRNDSVHRLIQLQEETNRRLTLEYWAEQIRVTPKLKIFAAMVRLILCVVPAFWAVSALIVVVVYGVPAIIFGVFRLLAGP